MGMVVDPDDLASECFLSFNSLYGYGRTTFSCHLVLYTQNIDLSRGKFNFSPKNFCQPRAKNGKFAFSEKIFAQKNGG